MSSFNPTNDGDWNAASGGTDGAMKRSSVTVTHMPDAVVVTVRGEIDLCTAPTFESTVRRSLQDQPALLVIDLTGAEFFSSAGIAVLVLAHRHPETALRVVANNTNNRIVLRSLELTGLAEELDIHPTLQSALPGPPA